MTLIIIGVILLLTFVVARWRYQVGFRDGFQSGRHAEIHILQKKIDEHRKEV